MKSGTMHSGLTNKSPKGPLDGDPSMKVKGGSVNAEPTRSTTGKTPTTLGPREA